jgi:hypothetical protein
MGEEEQCCRKGVHDGRRRLLPCRAGSEQASIMRESFTQTLVAFSMMIYIYSRISSLIFGTSNTTQMVTNDSHSRELIQYVLVFFLFFISPSFLTLLVFIEYPNQRIIIVHSCATAARHILVLYTQNTS